MCAKALDLARRLSWEALPFHPALCKTLVSLPQLKMKQQGSIHPVSLVLPQNCMRKDSKESKARKRVRNCPHSTMLISYVRVLSKTVRD